MEKAMHPLTGLLYRFSSRGIIWPLLCGSTFGIVILPFKTFLSSVIGIIIAYVIMFIFPRIGNIIFIILAAISAFIGMKQPDNFWGIYSLILFAVLLLRTLIMGFLRLKYPDQTAWLDMRYAQKQAEKLNR